jgi:glycosyltransferase involved in cell wall biosynthesis
MIPTHNCSRFLAETLASVISQDPGPARMQIEVVDDASSDDPETVLKSIAGDRVVFFRQPRNVGHIRNFTTCLTRSRGRLVHLLHGDDRVEPGFYDAMAKASDRDDVGAAFCRQIFIDEAGTELSRSDLEQPNPGVLPDSLRRLASEQRIMTPSIVVRRDVYEELGSFDNRLVYAEDWEMWVRIAAHHLIWYEPMALASYRMHGLGITGHHSRSGEHMRDTCRAIDVFSAYLQPELRAVVVPQAKETYALAAVSLAQKYRRRGDWGAAIAQVRAAIACRASLPVLRAIMGLVRPVFPPYARRPTDV